MRKKTILGCGVRWMNDSCEKIAQVYGRKWLVAFNRVAVWSHHQLNLCTGISARQTHLMVSYRQYIWNVDASKNRTVTFSYSFSSCQSQKKHDKQPVHTNSRLNRPEKTKIILIATIRSHKEGANSQNSLGTLHWINESTSRTTRAKKKLKEMMTTLSVWRKKSNISNDKCWGQREKKRVGQQQKAKWKRKMNLKIDLARFLI